MHHVIPVDKYTWYSNFDILRSDIPIYVIYIYIYFIPVSIIPFLLHVFYASCLIYIPVPAFESKVRPLFRTYIQTSSFARQA